MLTEKVSQKISALSTDLAVAISLNDPQAWLELAELCNDINLDLIAEAEFILSDLTARAKDILNHLAENQPSDIDTETSHLLNLISILTTAVQEQTYDQALAKEIVANTDIFLSDLENIIESKNVEPSVEIDEEFMQEIESRIDRLEKLLVSTIKDGCNDAEECRSIFREFHTLKGEAGILGLTRLSEYWHATEEVIQDARSGTLFFSRTAIDLLLQMVNFGRRLLRNGQLTPKQTTDSEAVLQKLQTAVSKTEEEPEEAEPTAELPESQTEPLISEEPATPAEPEFAEEVDTIFSTEPEDVEDDFFTMEPEDDNEEKEEAGINPDSTDDEQGITATDFTVEPEDNDTFKAVIIEDNIPPVIPEPTITVEPSEEEAPSELIPTEPEENSEPESAMQSDSPDNDPVSEPVKEKDAETYSLRNVQIEVKKLDQLLDIVSEVSLIGSHLASNPDISSNASASGDLQDLLRFCRTLNEMASSFRMTAIAPLFHRIQLAANDAARTMNKQVNMTLEGQDTRVDRIVIERLSAALIHLVRNSVGHGIEPSGRRRELNKNPVGRLHLSAQQTGADIIIEFSDDGSGLDINKIRQKAIDSECISADDTLKDSDILNLIFSSGFSTSESVDGISGRGVGMAIVQESMDSLRGRIEIDNNPGEGVTFRLRFPVALAAIEALLVTLGDNIIAIPVQSVRETFKLDKKQLSTVEGRGNMINTRGVIVPLIKMSEFLGIQSNNSMEEGVLILVDEGDKLAAILVDAVMETRQVVIRQLEGQLREIPEITGCALLSDRQISLVLDIRRVIENSYIASGTAYSDAGATMAAAERKVETVTIGSNAVGIIDFSVKSRKADGTVKNHQFAINAFKTREFVPVSNITPVPDMPEGFAGMLLLRDETIPVMSLDLLLKLSGTGERNHDFENIIIICEFSGVTVGFIVSEVNSVSYISWDDIAPPPQNSIISLKYVIGTILMSAIDKASHHIHDTGGGSDIAFLLDFELIVQQVINLYDDISDNLSDITLRKDITRILLVEDSPLIRRETARALEQKNILVLEAGDGLEAKKLLEKLSQQAKHDKKSIFNYIDLVLSDIEMPQMDGYSLTQFIKGHPDLRLLPVLLHSSLTNNTIVQRAKEVHADGFVPKCNPDKLVEHLKKHI